MLVLDEEQTRAALAWPTLIEAIAKMFAGGCVMPVRHHHDMEVPGESNATLLLMPAWLPGQYMGVKMVSVFPGNAGRAMPAIFRTYLLCSGKTGEMLAAIDGGELTARRTAATFGARGAISRARRCRGAAGLRHWTAVAQPDPSACRRTGLETDRHMGPRLQQDGARGGRSAGAWFKRAGY